MIKLVILEKYSPDSFCWNNLEKKLKTYDFSLEQVLNKYQGFEGDLVNIFVINEDELERRKILKTCDELYSSSKYLLLFVLSKTNEVPQYLKSVVINVGYDVGICEKDGTIYSSIFNEVLFGSLSELIVFQEKLNGNLLFPDALSAEKYVTLHEKLANQDLDVESYGKINIYKILRYVGFVA